MNNKVAKRMLITRTFFIGDGPSAKIIHPDDIVELVSADFENDTVTMVLGAERRKYSMPLDELLARSVPASRWSGRVGV